MTKLLLPNRPSVLENTEVIKEDDQLAQSTNFHLRKSGETAIPQGYIYLGSACFHMYKSKTVQDDYAFICATPVGGASEGMCDVGWKKLRSALMRAFGRAEPKVRR